MSDSDEHWDWPQPNDDSVRLVVRGFTCPVCAAPPGERCVTPSGRLAAMDHNDRAKVARVAGALDRFDPPRLAVRRKEKP